MELNWDYRKSFFVPSYNELSLFMMSAAFLLVFLTNSRMRSGIFNVLSEYDRQLPYTIAFVLVFIAGLALSIYHVFTRRRKGRREKLAMVFFAVLANAAGGICASVYILDESSGTSGIFMALPIWNIINCIILLMMLRAREINEKCISDENVRPLEAFLGLIIIAGVFWVCQFVFKLYWAITFSICIICATSFSDALGSMFHREGTAALGDRAKREERCGYCGRTIMEGETPWVINKNVIVCRECYNEHGRGR